MARQNSTEFTAAIDYNDQFQPIGDRQYVCGIRAIKLGNRIRFSVETLMKLIIAIIQPTKLEAVKDALSRVEVFRLTVMDVQGFGRQKGYTEVYRGHEVTVNLLRKIELQIAVNLDALAAHHRQLQIWAENCPENFENRAALVGAELARVEGRDFDAGRLYEQAVVSARDRLCPQRGARLRNRGALL